MFYKPMLAKSYDDAKHQFVWNGSYVMEQKYDGNRCQVEDGAFRSRTGKEFSFNVPMPSGQFDGELMVNPHLGIQEGHAEVSHWLAHDHSKLVLVLFDCLATPDCDYVKTAVAWRHRRRTLEAKFAEVTHPQVWLSQLVWDGKRETYERLIRDGFEGAVFKDADSVYCPGSRAANWVKMKAWDPVDCVITDCDSKPTEWRVRPGEVDKQTGVVSVEGIHTQPWLDGFVGLSYGYYDPAGRLVPVGSTGQTGPRSEMKQFVGRVGSYKSYGRVNETGALNHPVHLEWRDDKDAHDCVFDFATGKMVN